MFRYVKVGFKGFLGASRRLQERRLGGLLGVSKEFERGFVLAGSKHFRAVSRSLRQVSGSFRGILKGFQCISSRFGEFRGLHVGCLRLQGDFREFTKFP